MLFCHTDGINTAHRNHFLGSVKKLTGKNNPTNLETQITIETSLDGENWTIIHEGQIDLSPSPQEVTRMVLKEYEEQGGYLLRRATVSKKQQDKIAPQIFIKEFKSSTPLVKFSKSYGLWKTIELATAVTAKYIRIGLSEPAGAHARYVELAEIQIFGEVGTESVAKNNTMETGIKSNSFELAQNYPNPFNPSTEISFNLPEDAAITGGIHNVLGEKVRQLVNSNMTAGVHIIWYFTSAGFFLSKGDAAWQYPPTHHDCHAQYRLANAFAHVIPNRFFQKLPRD